jgi:hypothetical protein
MRCGTPDEPYNKPAVDMIEILYALISRHPEVGGKSLACFAMFTMSADKLSGAEPCNPNPS